jgi:PAS domain S-box-containing protein
MRTSTPSDDPPEPARGRTPPESHDEFLLRLSDALRPLVDPVEAQEKAAELVGRHLGASRAAYAEIEGEQAIVRASFLNGVPPLPAKLPYAVFGGQLLDLYRRGEAVAVDDVETDPRFTSAEAAALRELDIRAFAAAMLMKGGRWVAGFGASSASPRRWQPGEIAVIRDVVERTWEAAERARAEAALRSSEARYRTLFDTMEEGFAIGELVRDEAGRAVDFRLIELNAAFERLTGLARADTLGRPASDVLPGEHEWWTRTYAHIVDTATTMRFERDVQRLGRIFSVIAFPYDGGCFAVLYDDITERKHQEAALRENEQRFRSLVESHAQAVWEADPNGVVVVDSPSWRAYTGQSYEELMGHGWLEAIHPDDRQNAERQWTEAVAQRRKVNCEYRLRWAGGGWRWTNVRATPITAPGGSITKWVGMNIDIEARKSAEQERARAEAALQAADRQKNEFIAVLAHELRNPLAPIRTSTAVLQARASTDPVAERCRSIIERQVSQMSRLLDDLLDVARLSRGKLTLRKQLIRLSDVLEAAVETARPLIDERRHSLHVDAVPDSIVLKADAARLTQVFANLLNNAAKYTPPHGRIEVLVEQSDGAAATMVRDTGLGIDAAFRERMFDLFTQGREERERVGGGLGIGLALARRLIEMHGGTIAAESAGAGHGTAMIVTLPVAPPGSATAADAEAAVARPSVATHRVLVADDNIDAAETIAMLLGSSGCQVRTAYDGLEALREARQFRPQLVLLDLGMPGMDGASVCAQMRGERWGKEAVIVAITGWGRDDDRQRTREAGFDYHLVKPVDPGALVRLVRQLTRD